jgi:hypothetical protein
MNPFQKHAMNYGAIMGLGLTLIFFIQYFLQIMESLPISLLQYALITGIIIWSCSDFRKKLQNGSISYGRALGVGTMTTFYGSVIIAVVMVVFYKLIDPDALDAIRNYSAMRMEEEMYKQGMGEAEMEMAIEMSKKMISPYFIAFGSIFGLTIAGFLISLLTSAFIMKKNGNGFKDAMKEIDNDKK